MMNEIPADLEGRRFDGEEHCHVEVHVLAMVAHRLNCGIRREDDYLHSMDEQ
jgi:hypothetical protein